MLPDNYQNRTAGLVVELFGCAQALWVLNAQGLQSVQSEVISSNCELTF